MARGRRACLAGAVVTLYVFVGPGVLGTLPAYAASPAAVLLRPGDIPGSFHQVGSVQSFPNMDTGKVDRSSCVSSARSLAHALDVLTIEFAPSSDPHGTAALDESVVAFPSRPTAQQAFSDELQNFNRARACGSIRDGALMFTVAALAFPRVGDASFADRTQATTGVPATFSLTFLAGRRLVILATRETPGAPSVRDLKRIGTRARTRLGTAATG